MSSEDAERADLAQEVRREIAELVTGFAAAQKAEDERKERGR